MISTVAVAMSRSFLPADRRVSRLHLIFARVLDEQGEELGIRGFLAIRGYR